MFNGWIASPAVIVGCLIGGRLSDRMDRAYAYLAASLAIVVATVPFGVLPHTPTVWTVFGIIYTLMTGVAYGAYGGFVLDTAGTGAVAPSTTSSPRLPTFRSGTWVGSTESRTTTGTPTGWSGSTPAWIWPGAWSCSRSSS